MTPTPSTISNTIRLVGGVIVSQRRLSLWRVLTRDAAEAAIYGSRISRMRRPVRRSARARRALIAASAKSLA